MLLSLFVCVFRSYYESSELPSAIGVMEEALERHPELVSHECINMAAELFIANHQHDKALEVRGIDLRAPPTQCVYWLMRMYDVE